jgi:hypothetical protein
VKKDYQSGAARAAMSEIVVPDAVSVAMSELTGVMREGLLAVRGGRGPASDAGTDGRVGLRVVRAEGQA